ncbi:MAG: hypothetical protein ACRYFZ_26930 [Janthinobacterium lividum]
MSLQTFRTSPAPDFDEIIDTNYETVADVSYDEATIDPDYDQQADPDYDEGSQGEFADDFTDPEYEEGGQEYQPRKQK